MAIWNDPQPTGFGASSRLNPGFGPAAFDGGLRKYMLSIYNYMASGVLLSGVVALIMANTAFGLQLLMSPLRIVFMLAPLGFVLAMSFGMNRMQTSTLKALFWAYVVAMGASLATIFLVYTGASIALTFFASAGAFAGLSLFGYTTKKDLSGFGTFLIMGLIGLLIASIVGIFVHSTALQLAISAVGVLIFAGFTAYDTQKLKMIYRQYAGTPFAEKAAIMGALNLYLDFINLFMFLLRFMGDRR